MLSALVEGRLSPAEMPAVHAHLDECADCRELVAGAAAGVTRSVPPPPSGAALDGLSPPGGAVAQTMLPDTGEDTAPPDPDGAPRIAGYRIVERIGRGAMGEVYLAIDEQLERPVAIKLLSRTSEPNARRRFLNEARAVARLRHPNIVVIYSSDISGERPYIVSELLSGKSLDRLPLPLPGEEVLRVASALASGLAAAHRQGILHRDIKPANAMRTEDGEIKLLDFGLAKLADGAAEPGSGPEEAGTITERIQRTMTRTGALVGTPLYMAPEIWRGQSATPASDVYSLGALLYEICAGRPAHGATSVEALRREVTESSPPPLRRAAPSVDPALAAIIERCLARDPAARFASAVEVCAALDALRAPRRATGRTSRRVLTAAGIALGLGIAAFAGRGLVGRPSPQPAAVLGEAARSARRSIAILPFASRSPDDAWLSAALAEVLGACFAAGEALRIVPGDEVARMRTDLELRGRTSLGEDVLRRIRQYAAVDVVVTGALERTGEDGGLRVRAQMLDTASSTVLAAGQADVAEPAFRDAAILLAGALLPQVGQLPLSDAQVTEIRATMPESLLAAHLYSDGLERYRTYDFEAARDRLTRAAEADPENPMPHYRLGALWLSLGHEDNARTEARLAFERSSGLLREQRLSIEALHHRAQQDARRAVETLGMLHELFPDNVEYGLELAEVQPREEGLATLGRLRALPPPAGEDPRIDLTEYQIGTMTGSGLDAVRRAAEKGRARGARLVVGQAKGLEGWGLLDQGDLDAAKAALDEALPILEARGDVFNVTEVLRALGIIAMTRDDLDTALRHLERAESLLAAIGNHASYVYALRNVGTAYYRLGDTATNRKKLEEALRVCERSGNRNRHAQMYWILAVLEHGVGNMAAARAAFDRALQITEELNDRWVARMFQGDLGRFHLAAGDLQAARAAFEWAISGKDSEGRRRSAAPNRRNFALLELEDGRLDEAARLAGEALAEAEREGATADVALAEGVKARILAARGDVAGAAALADAALARLAHSKNQDARIRVSIDRAHAHARLADRKRLADVQKGLSEAEAAARRFGFGASVQEARFAGCEIAAARGGAAAARPCFAAAAAEARAKGFLLLARKAEALAGGRSPDAARGRSPGAAP